MKLFWRWSLLAEKSGIPLISTGLCALVVFGLRVFLEPDVPGKIAGPLFLAPVVISAWLGGMLAGLFAAALAIFCFEFFFMPPYNDLALVWADLPRIAIFILVGILISRLNAQRQRAEGDLEVVQEGMRIAGKIQQRLFPSAPPELSTFELAGRCLPAEATGGDYFDYLPMSNHYLGVVVGDVSGHGFASALLMTQTRAYLHALAASSDDIGAIVTRLNRFLAADTDEDRFLTLFLVRLDLVHRTFAYVGAGHEAYRLDSKGEAHRLRSTDLPLGIDGNLTIACSAEVGLGQGEILVILTDGVFEAESASGKPFGWPRVLEMMRTHRDKSATELVNILFAALRGASEGATQRDDATAIVVKGIAMEIPDGQRPTDTPSGSV